jgi:hypothetical protein
VRKSKTADAPIDQMIIRNMIPGNAKDRSARSEILKTVWHGGRCGEQLLAIAKSTAQF